MEWQDPEGLRNLITHGRELLEYRRKLAEKYERFARLDRAGPKPRKWVQETAAKWRRLYDREARKFEEWLPFMENKIRELEAAIAADRELAAFEASMTVTGHGPARLTVLHGGLA